MSQLTDLMEGKITLNQFITDVEGDVATVVKAVEGNPAVQTAVTGLQNAAVAVATDGIQWAETALSGVAANFSTDFTALVNKYLPQILGATPTGTATTAGTVTLGQQFALLLAQLAAAAGADIIKAL